VIAHPVRLKILDELTRGFKYGSDLEDFLEISKPNVSRHCEEQSDVAISITQRSVIPASEVRPESFLKQRMIPDKPG
jgi:hypothetical protein